MSFKFLSGLAIGIGLASPAVAETWQEVAHEGNATVYVDVGSVQREGDLVRFATQVRYNPPLVDGTFAYDSTIDARRGDCARMSDTMLHIMAYLGDKAVSRQIAGDGTAETHRPGSTGHASLVLVCRLSAAN